MQSNSLKCGTLACALAGVIATGAAAQEDLLPDIFVPDSYLYDNEIVHEGGHRVLRLSNGTANIGLGKLHLRGGETNGNTRTVYQRVFRTDGSWWERVAGEFTYHPNHGHMHYDEWAMYRLREIVGDDGVGDIVAEGTKTSFCIIDLGIYDPSLPNFNPNGEFFNCGSTTQGLSVGWVDIYSKGLSGQEIIIDGVPDGEYWLESEVDPNNNALESDETNNITRIRVFIGDGSNIEPDRYEPNESRNEVNGRTEGGPNSPNLGPCNPQKVIGNLTIDDGSDDDYFRFYMNHTGGGADFVRINFTHAQGDLDMALYNQNGSRVDSSTGTGNSETISLAGKPEGYYYVHVYGWNGATSPGYTLTIDPPSNQAPEISLLTPPEGDTLVAHGEESYPIQWNNSDPENDDTWVTIYANTQPAFDGNEILIPTSVNTPGDLGLFILNTAYLEHETYWVLAEITDGGTTTTDVSPGTITLVEFCPGDFNRDGEVDTLDVIAFLNAWSAQEPEADFNQDGTINTRDVLGFLNAWNLDC